MKSKKSVLAVPAFLETDMFFIKQMLKRDRIRIFLIAALLAFAGLAVRRAPGAVRNVSDWFCMVGLVHILVGCARYIRNVGLFKTFSYAAYKRQWKRNGHPTGETRPMSLAEYTQNVIMDEPRRRPSGWFLASGVFWCAVSLLLAVW